MYFVDERTWGTIAHGNPFEQELIYLKDGTEIRILGQFIYTNSKLSHNKILEIIFELKCI